MRIKKIKSIKIKRLSVVIFFLIFLFDISNFIYLSTKSDALNPGDDKVIIVLTGASQRIEEGFRLLENNYGKVLFISGVNPIVTKSDITKIVNPKNVLNKTSLFECCVFFEKKSYNTETNAIETNKWLKSKSYEKIILVTSAEHMPRSIFEFKKNTKYIDIQQWPVNTNTDKVFIYYKNIEKIIIEYIKLNITKLRYFFK
jgi:uncharacterized SAM-binding protein YcdF (DUF218 family)